MSNSNKKKGDDFRDLAMPILEKELNTTLESEVKISWRAKDRACF